MHLRRELNLIWNTLSYRIYLIRVRRKHQIVKSHFAKWSEPNHINRRGFEIAVRELRQKPALIIETGTSAWGTDSTRLWDTYIRKNGGFFFSVDLRQEASRQLFGQMSKRTHLIVNDSVKFLNAWNAGSPDLIYLDSLDLNLNEPLESADHGKRELLATLRLLKSGSLILIDDTPSPEWFTSNNMMLESVEQFFKEYEVLPGKGAFFEAVLSAEFEFEILHHDYSLLIRIK